jgi:glycosyltransferase involved in cell wall biosynthesis
MEILCIGANYPHKNLEILPKVRDTLRKYKFDFRIHLTIRQEDFRSKFHDEKNFINHGEVPLSKLASIYQKGSVLLFPTLLECFSATYLEAAYFYLPILTSDLPFAKTICGNHAEYFDPTDSEEIAKKIFTIYKDKNLYANLSKKSRKIYENSISSEERAKKIINYCEDIYLNG